MTAAISHIDRKIYWLLGIGFVLNQLMNVSEEPIFRTMIGLLSVAFHVSALVVMIKTDWLGIGAFIERRRRGR